MFKMNDVTRFGGREEQTFEGSGVLTFVSKLGNGLIFDCGAGSSPQHVELSAKGFPADTLTTGKTYEFEGDVDLSNGTLVLHKISEKDEPRIEREQGVQLLVDPFEQIVMGDQHHADAVDALRRARGRPYVLIVEEMRDDKPSMMMWTGAPNSETGAPVYRLSQYMAAAAAKIRVTASHIAARYMASAMTETGGIVQRPDDEDDDNG